MNTLVIAHNFKREELYLHTLRAFETRKLGEHLGRILKGGDIVCLIGGLGTGKTTLVQGIAKGVGVNDYVNSPTFKLINEYKGKYPVYHFDLYRLDSVREVEELGYKEYFYNDGITIIEWADKIVDVWPQERLEIYFEKQDDSRKIKILFYGKRFKEYCKELKGI